MKLNDWAGLWKCDLLDNVPVVGHATSATWRNAVPGTTRAPGKNHPDLGAWLLQLYCSDAAICVDPMFGSGGLWINAPLERVGHLEGCEIEASLSSIGRSNARSRRFRSAEVACNDAATWTPSCQPDVVLFSPPFLQNHSSGATEKQKLIREKKALHTMQEFGAHPENLGRKKPSEFWAGMDAVYKNIASYIRPSGVALVILRNRIRSGQEVDEVGRHIGALRGAGFSIPGVHARDLERPTGYQAWKLARNPATPWIRYEWVVVAQANSRSD